MGRHKGPTPVRSSREAREYVLPWPPLPHRWKEWKVSRGEPKLKLTRQARHYRKDIKAVALTQVEKNKPFPPRTPVIVRMKLWFPYDTGQGAPNQRASTVLEALKGVGIRRLDQVWRLHVERMPNDRYNPRVWVHIEEFVEEER